MLDTEIIDFHRSLLADIQSDAESSSAYAVESFFAKSVDLLAEAGEIEGATWSHYSGKRRRKLAQDKVTKTAELGVTGFSGDPNESNNILSLILIDMGYGEEPHAVGSADVKKAFNQLVEFVRAARDPVFRDSLEEASEGAALIDLIWKRWTRIEKFNLFFVTNGIASSKVDTRSMGSIDGKDVIFNVWDLTRLRRFIEQGNARETLFIDFENEFNEIIPVLECSALGASINSYLAVISGSTLAAIYEKWGPRLLEANVRGFLQAKGAVNKGIRKTIIEEPHMFLAYNNGLSVTADKIDLVTTENGTMMISAENMQIVNGGQTTASLHSVRKEAAEQLKNVRIQMKINLVSREQSEEVVPRISEYANSQNKVNAADFFANHPFHVRVEELSRRVLAPAGVRGYVERKWFYERARGQYADARSKLTIAARKKFDTDFPKSCFFTKTDLAKFVLAFDSQPDVVSLGAQKCFVKFAENTGKKWGESGEDYDELWFKRLVAKAIVFRETERMVSRAEWYQGGYRANIVAYAIAKLSHDLSIRSQIMDLDQVWKLQALPNALEEALSITGEAAQFVILNGDSSVRHTGEWTKKAMCWKRLKEQEINFDRNLENAAMDLEEYKSCARERLQSTKETNNLIGETKVIELGGYFWQKLYDWGMAKRAFTENEANALKVCSAIPRKIPNELQCKRALSTLKKAEGLGFKI
ncbi:AIPR family protein [Pseudochrobactrum sp. B5]|uniref:AIPR family protein n=1 Tax=Pseudochrobactrum sp. B5 TaxID=1289478 RepID=UPI000952787C|nr:AIPR family protein [Pseudochrobactrum sp. B5]